MSGGNLGVLSRDNVPKYVGQPCGFDRTAVGFEGIFALASGIVEKGPLRGREDQIPQFHPTLTQGAPDSAAFLRPTLAKGNCLILEFRMEVAPPVRVFREKGAQVRTDGGARRVTEQLFAVPTHAGETFHLGDDWVIHGRERIE